MIQSAKDFSAATGWPVKTIRAMCRRGELPCLQRGRVYLVDAEVATRVLAQAVAADTESRRGTRTIRVVRRSGKFDFKARLAEI